MAEKIVVGPVNKGLRTDRTPFVIDNDSFPVLINAYQWRGRIKRKRGNDTLGRLERYFNSQSSSYNPTGATLTLNGSGQGTLLSSYGLADTNGAIVPTTVSVTDSSTSINYKDLSGNGVLIASPSGTNGSINYATSVITIPGGAGHLVTSVFNYYPGRPVMGLEGWTQTTSQFPGTIAFDTKYSYNQTTGAPYANYDVSFYKNPLTGAYPGYTQKANPTPVVWNGMDYQQFWTTNYEGALWTTNGVNVPFSPTNVGMPFKPITTVTVISTTSATLTIPSHGLVVGDFVFVNEVATTTGINLQTGYVTTVSDANNVVVTFPYSSIATNGTGGIAQYLTNKPDATKDCMRWFDGDPTNGSVSTPLLNRPYGWVNFCPPLSNAVFSIDDLPKKIYYLVTASLVLPFKDRLLFFGPVIQASTGAPIYLQDTIIFSQNGAAYYTCGFTGANPFLGNVSFTPILVPDNQLATAPAYMEDAFGFGGNLPVGTDQPITTVSTNEDVLIMGFPGLQTRVVYTGSDLLPFSVFVINSELGASATFSAINLDRGVISVGTHGISITSQTEAQRIDLDIPDSVFEFGLGSSGPQRICAQRDFINEWIYITYPTNQQNTGIFPFPSQTLLYNYRDQSWAVFKESFTTYGQFYPQSGNTWATIGNVFPSWAQWNVPWGAGASTAYQPKVIGGNSQGYILVRDEGTTEEGSLYISGITGSPRVTIISYNHGLNVGDFIFIDNCIGSTTLNGQICEVLLVPDANTFVIASFVISGTYIGGGTITRLYRPFIQTKQFPVSWGMSRKTRIGPQQYLFTTTASGQITVQIYLSQNASYPYNSFEVVPNPDATNNALVYSNILYTSPETTNMGLSSVQPYNLNTPTAPTQAQLWHRMNTSLIGDTIQIGFTMSDVQMKDPNLILQFAEIELHSFILEVSPSQLLV